MTASCRWARRHQKEDFKQKLCGSGVDHKTWWRLVKEQQGTGHHEAVPQLTRADGSMATSSKDKPSLLTEFFTTKMKVNNVGRRPLHLPQETEYSVSEIQVTPEQVEHLMREIEESKATGPDDVSPRHLKHCTSELSGPLTSVFQSCLRERRWPSTWKKVRVVPAHKKIFKSEPSNYRPISLLSVVSKLLEQVVASVICHYLSEHRLRRGV